MNMRPYKSLFREEDSGKFKIISRINESIQLIKDRYETLDYVRDIAGKGHMKLSQYLPIVQKPIPTEMVEVVNRSKEEVEQRFQYPQAYDFAFDNTEDKKLFAGIVFFSFDKLKQHLNYIAQTETAGFKPPMKFHIWLQDSEDKAYDVSPAGQYVDAFYIGMEISKDDYASSQDLLKDVQSWFTDPKIDKPIK